MDGLAASGIWAMELKKEGMGSGIQWHCWRASKG